MCSNFIVCYICFASFFNIVYRLLRSRRLLQMLTMYISSSWMTSITLLSFTTNSRKSMDSSSSEKTYLAYLRELHDAQNRLVDAGTHLQCCLLTKLFGYIHSRVCKFGKCSFRPTDVHTASAIALSTIFMASSWDTVFSRPAMMSRILSFDTLSISSRERMPGISNRQSVCRTRTRKARFTCSLCC